MSRRYRVGLGGRWKNPPGQVHAPMSEEELRALAVGTVLSFDLGRLRVSAVKYHGERFTLHSRTVPIGVLAGVPALRRVLRDRVAREESQ